MPDHILESGDSPELEALFESIAKQQASQQEAPSAEVDGANPQAALAIYAQVGQMTRKLHDALRELGYDKSLEKVADALPDAKDRLGYIATLTANAAERVLNATDIARPIQDELQSQSASLSGRWDQLFANQLSVDDFKLLAADTRRFLAQAPQQTAATNAQLLEIVMAQDFQDLTGQMIRKVIKLVQEVETKLIEMLTMFGEAVIENSARSLPASGIEAEGPIMNPQTRSDVVNGQDDVDDLLSSLGF